MFCQGIRYFKHNCKNCSNGIDFSKSEYISKLMNGSINLFPVIPAFAGLDQTEKKDEVSAT